MVASRETLQAAWLSDEALQRLMALVAQAGFEVRAVGGCVRDTLLGYQGQVDVDLATTMPAEDAMQLLRDHDFKVVPTGLAHGTITAITRDATPRHFEITTLRRDIATDGRHAITTYTDDWLEDARRRDLTINALYVDAHGHIYDPLAEAGLCAAREDLMQRHIRFIGDAGARIAEDYLRVLRYFRFHFRLAPDQPLDAEAFAACKAHAWGVAQLSPERITDELMKIAQLDDFAGCLRSMIAAGLWEIIFASPPPTADNLDALERLTTITHDPLLRLGGLFAKPEQVGAARLRFSNATRARLNAMLDVAMAVPEETAAQDVFIQFAYWHGVEATCDHILLRAARSNSAVPRDLLSALAAWQRPSCPVRGEHLIAQGLQEGPDLGAVLKRLESDWVASGFVLSRTDLLARLP